MKVPVAAVLFYDCDDEEIPAMGDGGDVAETMLGLDGVRVTDVCEADGEVTIEVETTEPRAWCQRGGCRAESQVVLTRRTGAAACRRVGELARPVSHVADEFGVCWETVMNAVVEHGTPLVDDPVWLGGIEVVTTIWSSRSGPGCRRTSITPPASLIRSTWSASPNRCLDAVRRLVQNETLGHRGRKDDPLYRIRKLLLTGSERLNERGRDRMLLSPRTGDPQRQVVGAWLAKESLRHVYLAGNYDDAAVDAGQGHRRLPSR